MVKQHMVGALNSAMKLAMKEHDNMLVLGEDVGVDGGVFRVTEGLQEEFGKDRVVDTPLAEAGIVGSSIGLAINGMRPVCEMQFSGFSYQALHHVIQHMSRFRQRSNSTASLPMVLRAPCAGGIRALEHHSESPESYYIHAQGIKVVMPSGPKDAKGLLIAAIKDNNPVVFLEPKSIYRSFKEEVPEEAYEIELGKANVVQEGSDVTIVTWGAMTRATKKAVDELGDVSCEIIDLRTLWPFDIDTIVKSVEKTKRAVVVQEATRACSLSSEIVAQIQERCVLKLEAPVKRVTAFDLPFPQFALEKYFLPNTTRIKTKIKEVVDF
ncbi:MAG: alpha-ketoacid dehydrogenase subunit beta [Nanoarchaeota archaeon]|nr:alpha-ketoacid dehydrogenase subunit beta [Nanoarchaeota archaeon]